jgi:alkanesulfonate monooxygenase SsuD/methylene tetrahydromethanopterin reductase-like flavin-dependent oxidoreductase (luciferase family)
MHVLISLAAHGWHPAAWRVSGAPKFDAGAAFPAMARIAEQAGAHALLFGLPAPGVDRRSSGAVDLTRLDPLTLLGSLIGVTSRIGLCAYWPADVAEPYHVARVFATLDHLSGGRTGWMAGLAGDAELGARYRYLDLPPPGLDREARLAELVDVTRQLWDSWEDRGFVADPASGAFADPAAVRPIDHAGRFFTVRGPLNVPRPVQGQPVILHQDRPAGAARALAAVSAELVVASCATIAEARAARRDWRAEAERHGRDPDDVRFIVAMLPILAETAAAAMQRAQELDALVPGEAAPVRLVGTPEDCASQIAEWHAAGACDGIDLRPAVGSRDLPLIAAGLMPSLRRQGLLTSAGATLRSQLGLRRQPSRFAAQ